ncbi:MAG: ArsR family transcriptional regulator [Methylococcales bacterium]|jgi:predicted ArsR family transcriptional regulator|nr:ArsR family transcriptional regulator [Methylococcales bacterium]
MNKIGQRQHDILAYFLTHKKNLCIEDLYFQLGISRTAVQEHFSALENAGYIEKNGVSKTNGRPIVLYGITHKGINYFPKQYSWLAGLMLEDLLETISAEESEKYMRHLGIKLASQLSDQFEGKSLDERLETLMAVMNDLGFNAKQAINEKEQVCIQACNCIYHDLAQKHEQICQFDLALLEGALEKPVKQSRCMAKGDTTCEFLF